MNWLNKLAKLTTYWRIQLHVTTFSHPMTSLKALQRLITIFTGSDPDGLIERLDEYLAVTDTS